MLKLSSSLLLVAALIGCAQTQDAATTVKSVVQAQTTPTLSTGDATFLNSASQAGITAVTLSQLARERGQRAATRDFALRTVGERTALNQQLVQLSTAKQISPTTTVDPLHQITYDQLAALQGRAFDRGYLNEQVADDTTLLRLFQDEAANGTDPDVKALASRNVAGIKAHLTLALKLGGRASPTS